MRVGLYTSPHLLRYNERVRIAGRRGNRRRAAGGIRVPWTMRASRRRADGAPTPLTYFEFGTLAALWLFARAELDALVLEVGLGGRLDAVNVVDADGGGTHERRLSTTRIISAPPREDIGREKAGIFRAGRPALSARIRIRPRAWSRARRNRGAACLRIGRDYGFRRTKARNGAIGDRAASAPACPFPALRGAYQLGNAATAFAVLDLLGDRDCP